MKTLVLLILIGVAVSSCSTPESCTCTSTVVDVSDSFLSLADLKPHMLFQKPVFGSPQFYEGYAVSLRTISNLEHTKAFHFTVPAVSQLDAHDESRKKELQAMEDSIGQIIVGLKTVHKGTPGSAIFSQLIKSVKEISDDPLCTSRTLYLFSDLRETELFNSYTDLADITTHPEIYFTKLNAAAPIGDLHGLRVILLHQSRTRAEDKAHTALIAVLSHYLSSHNAVLITPY